MRPLIRVRTSQYTNKKQRTTLEESRRRFAAQSPYIASVVERLHPSVPHYIMNSISLELLCTWNHCGAPNKPLRNRSPSPELAFGPSLAPSWAGLEAALGSALVFGDDDPGTT